jgi:hypothetical protein
VKQEALATIERVKAIALKEEVRQWIGWSVSSSFGSATRASSA